MCISKLKVFMFLTNKGKRLQLKRLGKLFTGKRNPYASNRNPSLKMVECKFLYSVIDASAL